MGRAIGGRGVLTARDFKWDEYYWKTTLDLGDGRLATGPVEVVFAPEGRGDGPMSEHEVRLVDTAASTIGGTMDAAVGEVFKAYRNLREQDDCADDPSVFMPEVVLVDEMYGFLTLSSVYVHCMARSGVPYVGLEFTCPWDPEHGVGVLARGTRIVEVGGADTASLLWIAERDAAASEGGVPMTSRDPQ